MDEQIYAAALDGLGPAVSGGLSKNRQSGHQSDLLEAHVDSELANPDRVSDADNLAGRISRGQQINAFRSIPPLVAMFICASARNYVPVALGCGDGTLFVEPYGHVTGVLPKDRKKAVAHGRCVHVTVGRTYRRPVPIIDDSMRVRH